MVATTTHQVNVVLEQTQTMRLRNLHEGFHGLRGQLRSHMVYYLNADRDATACLTSPSTARVSRGRQTLLTISERGSGQLWALTWQPTASSISSAVARSHCIAIISFGNLPSHQSVSAVKPMRWSRSVFGVLLCQFNRTTSIEATVWCMIHFDQDDMLWLSHAELVALCWRLYSRAM